MCPILEQTILSMAGSQVPTVIPTTILLSRRSTSATRFAIVPFVNSLPADIGWRLR